MMSLKAAFDIRERPEHAFARRLDVPGFVAGAGLISTWLSLFHTHIEPGAAVDVPLAEVLLDVVLVLACLACALASRRLGPLASRPSAVGLSCAAMVGGTLVASWGSGISAAFLLGGALGTVGAALALLLWKEFFACLSSARIALYVACSIVAGEAFRLVLIGFTSAYLTVAMALLPVFSTAALLRAFRSLPVSDMPRTTRTVTWRVPGKLLAVVAAYSLCYGLVAKTGESSVAITALSKLLPALLVIASVLFQSERFGFGDVYRLGMPLAICGGALFCGFSGMDPTIANFFVSFGYIVCRILATVELGSIARTSGIGATYLFGVQVAVQYASSSIGKAFLLPVVQTQVPDEVQGALTFAACLVAAVVALFFMRDKRRSEPTWGLSTAAGEPVSERAAAALRARRAARAFGLSEREYEILDLLLTDMTLARIGRELCIAEGTVKSHANRIYRKMSVAGRRDLADAVDAPEVSDGRA